MALGLVLALVPGATPKKPALRVDRPQPPVRADAQPGDVVADRPDLPAAARAARPASRGSSCRRRSGTRPRCRSRCPSGSSRPRMSMCSASQPSSRAMRSSRCAARGTSCRAARCRRSRSRRSRSCCSSGKCTMKRRSGSRSPSGVQAGHEVVAASPSCVERDLAHARHDAHVGDDVGAVGDLDADLGEAASPAGPSG